jgi:type III secretion system YscD/HrpQ family protein
MADDLSFRVFSGPHNGLVFDLKPGRYLVGSGTDCDLIFADRQMADKSCVLEVSGESVKVELFIAGKYQGENVEPSTIFFESGKFLQIGDSIFSFRKADIHGPWAEPSFSTVVTPEETAAEPKEEQNVEAEDKNKDLEQQESKESEEIQQIEDNTAGKRKNLKVYLQTIFLGLAFLLLLGALMFGPSFFREPSSYNDMKVLAKTLEENDFGALEINLDENTNTIEIKGDVESPKVYATLSEILPDLSTRLVMNVDVRDDEIIRLEHDFAALGFVVRCRHLEGNKIAVHAYMFDRYVQADAFRAMEKKYKGRLVGFISYRDEVERTLKGELYNEGIKEIKLVMGKGKIYYNGRTTVEDENSIEKSRYLTGQKLNIPLSFTRYDPKEYVSIAQFDNKSGVSVSAGTDGILNPGFVGAEPNVTSQHDGDETIVGVTMKPMRFITLRNGRRYFEGGVMSDGYTIEKIDLHKIVLSKGTEIKELELK